MIYICLAFGAVLLILLMIGERSGKGPFSYMHSFDDQIKTLRSSEETNGILFVGADQIGKWPTLQQEVKPFKVVNNGIDGIDDQEILASGDKLIYSFNPKVMFYFNSTMTYKKYGNTSGKSLYKIMEDKKNLFNTIHQNIPDCKIVLVSALNLPARSRYLLLNDEVNKQLQQLSQENEWMDYIDVTALTFDGYNIDATLYEFDHLTLNSEGKQLLLNNYLLEKIKKYSKEI